MATLLNNSSGNFTTAATWSLVDATSLLDSETNTTNTTTAFVSSSAFTPGAIIIDGIAVKVSARSGAPTGTFSVRLHDGTAAVIGTTVTINVTDIIAVNGSTNTGWIFMKFSAPVSLIVATNYTVQVQTSTNAQVTLYRDATASNWSRLLRTTTTKAPASGDNLVVAGERTGATTGNSFTVTMDNADAGATTFGNIQICGRGTLDWGTTASTAYYLKLGGNLTVYTNSIYQQGNPAGTRVPATSSASLEFVCGSNVQFGFESRLGSTCTGGGALITNSAFLAADAAAAATSLTTNVSTGWLNGDLIALASTTRTKAESESKALTANASGTTLTITAITNAHSGTSPTAGELINLTRNVKIFSASTTNQTYVNILGTAIINFDSMEFYNMGSATASKRGIDLGINTGSATITNCSIHDFNVASSIGLNINSGTANNHTITNNVFYNTASSALIQSATTNSSYTINNNIAILTGATCFNIADLTGTITNLTAVSATGAGITLQDSVGTATEIFGTLSGFISHSNTTIGVSLVNLLGVTNNPMGTISNVTTWRNTTNGLNLSNAFSFIVDTVTSFGNATANVSFGGTDCANIYLKNMTINSGVTLTCPIGLNIAGDCYEIYVDNSTFGATTTHSTGDVNVSGVLIWPRVTLRNCLRSSTTKLSNAGNMTENAYIASARNQQTAGSHITTKKYGVIIPDTTIFNKGSPSVRMTPNNAQATNKLQGSLKKVAVPNGQTVVINVYVRKSVAGDGTAYNGNQPRLILKADPAVGITSDTVIATSTAAGNGAFELLTGTTVAITDDAVFQFYVDCDGTAGWINVDDWSVNS